MANEKLVDYFKQYGSQYPVDKLKASLIKQGYNATDVEEAAAYAGQNSNVEKQPLPPDTGSNAQDFFSFDQKTKDTMMSSIIGLLIAQIVIFFGDFLVGRQYIYSLIFTVVYALIGGAIAGFLLSKLYDPIMNFISGSLRFLLPITNTFFKFLFVPVLIGSVIGLLFGLLAGSAIFLIGASSGVVGGGILGGLLGGSIIISTIWSIVITILSRFIYAKFMVFRVGKYYKDYK